MPLRPAFFSSPLACAAALTLALPLAACGDDGGDPPAVPGDGGPPDAGDFVSANPPREGYRRWIKIEPPGAVCSDGSQYKFFVNFSTSSDNLLIDYEPGGACWDYPSCSGQTGIMGAANPNGIPDDHMNFWGIASPLLRRSRSLNPAWDWNMIFMPYCTGDVHTGNNDITYTDETGTNPPLLFRHRGHDNTMKAIDWIDENFPVIPRMFVTGCSAGGVGSQVNYYFLRSGLPQVQHGYLLNDSGPVFPGGGYSDPLHAKIRVSWNVDPILDSLPDSFDVNDFGAINTLLADQFPRDRLAVTFFRRDYNFSVYSYRRFYTPEPTKDEIHAMFWQDTQNLVAMYDTRDNLGYYIPYFREFNDSHCTSVLGYGGTDIAESGVDLLAYIQNLLDDSAPLQSYLESPQPGEDL
jgi:hypothetical protein